MQCNCETVAPMKNITLAVDEQTYRGARIAAAERGTSVSALVRAYLQSLSAGEAKHSEATAALFDALDRAEELTGADRLSRDEAHAR